MHRLKTEKLKTQSKGAHQKLLIGWISKICHHITPKIHHHILQLTKLVAKYGEELITNEVTIFGDKGAGFFHSAGQSKEG